MIDGRMHRQERERESIIIKTIDLNPTFLYPTLPYYTLPYPPYKYPTAIQNIHYHTWYPTLYPTYPIPYPTPPHPTPPTPPHPTLPNPYQPNPTPWWWWWWWDDGPVNYFAVYNTAVSVSSKHIRLLRFQNIKMAAVIFRSCGRMSKNLNLQNSLRVKRKFVTHASCL